MNAAIRTVVRMGIHKGWEGFGIRRGYAGLIGGHLQRIFSSDFMMSFSL
jgi:6-phosphofructokinase